MSLPYDYYPLVMQVIRHLQTGETLTQSCHLAGISYSIFKGYVEKAPPEVQNLALDAERMGQDMLADKLVNIDSIVSDPQMANVISKNIQWLLSRRRRLEYGDRVDHTVTHRADKSVEDALDAALARATKPPSIEGKTQAIDVEYHEVVTPVDSLPEHDRALLDEMFR